MWLWLPKWQLGKRNQRLKPAVCPRNAAPHPCVKGTEVILLPGTCKRSFGLFWAHPGITPPPIAPPQKKFHDFDWGLGERQQGFFLQCLVTENPPNIAQTGQVANRRVTFGHVSNSGFAGRPPGNAPWRALLLRDLTGCKTSRFSGGFHGRSGKNPSLWSGCGCELLTMALFSPLRTRIACSYASDHLRGQILAAFRPLSCGLPEAPRRKSIGSWGLQVILLEAPGWGHLCSDLFRFCR